METIGCLNAKHCIYPILKISPDQKGVYYLLIALFTIIYRGTIISISLSSNVRTIKAVLVTRWTYYDVMAIHYTQYLQYCGSCVCCSLLPQVLTRTRSLTLVIVMVIVQCCLTNLFIQFETNFKLFS